MTVRTQSLPAILPLMALRGLAPWRLGSLFALYRQRTDLGRLDDRMLRDIGVSRAAAENEAARPVWDVPATWRA